jgi:hypothetical protein
MPVLEIPLEENLALFPDLLRAAVRQQLAEAMECRHYTTAFTIPQVVEHFDFTVS